MSSILSQAQGTTRKGEERQAKEGFVAGLLRPRSAHLTTAVTGNTLQKKGFVPAWEKKNVLFLQFCK